MVVKLKNTVMSLPDKFIVFLGRTLSGHNHDYIMLKQEFPPELDWLTDINVRVDLGYLDMALWYSPEYKIIVLSTTYVNRLTLQYPEKRVQR